MSNYVKITQEGGVRVSLDGLNTTLLEEGQIYDVPAHVKQALIESKRGKEPTKRDLKRMLDEAAKQMLDGAQDDEADHDDTGDDHQGDGAGGEADQANDGGEEKEA